MKFKIRIGFGKGVSDAVAGEEEYFKTKSLAQVKRHFAKIADETGGSIEEFEFDTPEEVAAFRKGIEAMDGWSAYYDALLKD